MGSPIDRTAKAALDSNLVNGVTSDAPKVKANNDVLYNYSDGLNNALDAHAAAATLPHADSSVTGPKIRDGAVTTAKIADLAVTRPLIAVGAVGSQQLDPTLLTDFGDIAVQAEFDRRGLSVLKFGAVGDGTANDTTAINSALTAVGNAGGGIVYIPKGVYLITASLVVPSNTKLLGAGSGATILKVGANGINVITSGGTDYVTIRDIGINGQGSTVGTGFGGSYGVLFQGTQHFLIENVSIVNMGNMNMSNKQSDAGYAGNGIACQSSGTYASRNTQYGVIRNCYVSQVAGGGINSGDGIYIGSYSTGQAREIIIEDCFVEKTGRHCYTVAGSGTFKPENITFRNCTAKQSGLDGIDLEIGNRILIDGCKFYNCGNDQTFYNPLAYFLADFRLFWAIAMTSSMKDVQITDCLFDTCYGSVSTSSTEKVVISRCSSISSVSDDYHLYAGSGTFQSVLRDLLIQSPGRKGIVISNSKNLLITHCIIMDGGENGIEINGFGAGGPNMDITISHTQIIHCVGEALYINNGDGFTLTSNTLKNNVRGIHIRSGGGTALRRFIITGNHCYDDQTTKTQDFGIFYEISTGSQDEFIVVGNNFKGNKTASINGTLGAASQIANNIT